MNRIQKKLIFYPLGKETVKCIIVEKILKDFNQRLSSKGIHVILSDSAIAFLMDKGYNETYGAREMQRTFEQYICEPLSQMILKGEVKSGERIKVSTSDDGIYFDVV
ncbi:MAG: hypothetical protein AB1567_07085 [bacterium]